MSHITVRPLTQWAKNRVRQHGAVFHVVKIDGERVLVRSLGAIWKGANGMETWLVWLELGVDAELTMIMGGS